jgi:hypothetical protein
VVASCRLRHEFNQPNAPKDFGKFNMNILCPMKYTFEFQIGQIVFLKTDVEQFARMVTGITIRPNNSVTYYLSFGETESKHFAIEIYSDKDILESEN